MAAFIPLVPVSTAHHSSSFSSARISRHALLSAPAKMASSTFVPTFNPAPLSSPNFCYNVFTMLLENQSSGSVTANITERRRQHLTETIISGPVFKSAGLSISGLLVPNSCSTNIEETCLDDWLETGAILEEALGRQSNDTRVYQYYLPVYFWILRELAIHKARIAASPDSTHRPFILGFCCPQGGGKTTMTTFMQTLLRSVGHSVQIASLDDFYLTNAEQQKLAKRYPDNKMMQYRGMPGTHDLKLLNSTLDSLRHGHDVSIPKYDKTAFAGRGDRAPLSQWKHISETTDIVLLEGWCLGFEPVEEQILVNPDLSVVNEALSHFKDIYKRLDGLFLIEISNMDWVYEWRLQAERGSRAAGKAGLSDDEVIDFVSRFMPAYKQYSTPLYSRATPLIPMHELHIEIDEERRPVHRKTN